MESEPDARRHSSLRTAYRKICLGSAKPSNRRVPRVSVLDFGGDFFVEVTNETERIMSTSFFGGLILDVTGRGNVQSPLSKRFSRKVLEVLIRESRVKQLSSGDDDVPRAMKSPSCPNMNYWRASTCPRAICLPKPLPEILRDIPYPVPELPFTKKYEGKWNCGPCVDDPRQVTRKTSKFATLDNWIPDLTKSASSFPVQLYDAPHANIRHRRSDGSTLVSREWGREAPNMLDMDHKPILEKGRFQQEPETMDSPILNNEWRAAHFDSDIHATLVTPDLTKIPDRFRFPALQTTPAKPQHRFRSLSRSFVQRLRV